MDGTPLISGRNTTVPRSSIQFRKITIVSGSILHGQVLRSNLFGLFKEGKQQFKSHGIRLDSVAADILLAGQIFAKKLREVIWQVSFRHK